MLRAIHGGSYIQLRPANRIFLGDIGGDDCAIFWNLQSGIDTAEEIGGQAKENDLFGINGGSDND